MKKFESAIDPELEAYLATFPIDKGPPKESPQEPNGVWEPRHNPTQRKVFNSTAKYILVYGEKGSGKSISGLDALIRHCYEEDDALALIIAPALRTGKEGVISDLMWRLDIWRNGNTDPKDSTGETRLDEGLGLDYKDPALDPQTKDRVIYIGNQFGGWSKVMLVSMPYASVVETRMKGMAPSFVYLDEVTELESKEFFTYVTQQIGRRRKIRGPQQYLASCNPEGPSHWVYQVFWEDCIVDGKRNPDFEVYHVPVSENLHNLPPEYTKNLNNIFIDPIDRARLIEGKWVDRPAGDSIFKAYWQPEFHVRGNIKEGTRLVPLNGYPIVVSYDPGAVNYSIHFMQMVPTIEKMIWIVFDELNFVGEFTPEQTIVKRILEKMDYWNAQLGNSASFHHICPEDAFTHRRNDGSYDATRLVQLSGGRIRPRGCPQAKQSVPTRVQMLINMLLNGTLFVSATCVKTLEMFRMLASEKPKTDKYEPNRGLMPKRSVYLHPFDSLSYGPYYFTLMPAALAAQTGKIEPAVYGAGGN